MRQIYLVYLTMCGGGAAVYNIQRFIESFPLPADLLNLDLAKNSGRYDVTFWPLPWVAMHWKALQVHWHGPWGVWKNPGLLFGIARCVCLVSLCLFHYGHCEMSWSILVLHHELMKCAHCWVVTSTDNPRRVSQSCCSYEWLQWDIMSRAKFDARDSTGKRAVEVRAVRFHWASVKKTCATLTWSASSNMLPTEGLTNFEAFFLHIVLVLLQTS